MEMTFSKVSYQLHADIVGYIQGTVAERMLSSTLKGAVVNFVAAASYSSYFERYRAAS